MIAPVRIVDLMRGLVTKTSAAVLPTLQAVDPGITGVHYEYGHYNDVKERLMAKGKTDKPNRYPLVVLFEDFGVTNGTLGIYGVVDVKLMVLHTSRKDITRPQREANVFNPVLVPIYDELMVQLKFSGLFMQYGPFQHRRIDRPHWGDPALYGNAGYLFDDILDGIEIADLQLRTYLNNCINFKTWKA